jgi:hypothetical protein
MRGGGASDDSTIADRRSAPRGAITMRLTERSMLRLAGDLHVEDRAAEAATRRRWTLEDAPARIVPVARVHAPASWLSRIWRVATTHGPA